MIDKQIEANLLKIRSFREFWGKFHSIYNELSCKERLLEEDDAKFLETKEMLRKKYEELIKALDFKYMPHTRLTDPVESILSLGTIRFIAEKNARKIEDDWLDSYIFLNSVEEHLKNRKRRLENVSFISLFFKNLMKR